MSPASSPARPPTVAADLDPGLSRRLMLVGFVLLVVVALSQLGGAYASIASKESVPNEHTRMRAPLGGYLEGGSDSSAEGFQSRSMGGEVPLPTKDQIHAHDPPGAVTDAADAAAASFTANTSGLESGNADSSTDSGTVAHQDKASH